MRQLIARAKRLFKTPGELIGLSGWALYLFDEAADYLERRDELQTKDPQPKLRIMI